MSQTSFQQVMSPKDTAARDLERRINFGFQGLTTTLYEAATSAYSDDAYHREVRLPESYHRQPTIAQPLSAWSRVQLLEATHGVPHFERWSMLVPAPPNAQPPAPAPGKKGRKQPRQAPAQPATVLKTHTVYDSAPLPLSAPTNAASPISRAPHAPAPSPSATTPSSWRYRDWS
ncbi:hypothetical protein EV714DRAFT_269771 [Schizophyllum commune]